MFGTLERPRRRCEVASQYEGFDDDDEDDPPSPSSFAEATEDERLRWAGDEDEWGAGENRNGAHP